MSLPERGFFTFTTSPIRMSTVLAADAFQGHALLNCFAAEELTHGFFVGAFCQIVDLGGVGAAYLKSPLQKLR